MLIYLICASFFLLNTAAGPEKNLVRIGGTTAPGWDFLRDLFKENFDKQRDVGGSLAIYHHGRPVVDLWGGSFDRSSNKPYDNGTLQLVFSTTKGLVAAAAALCVQRGLLDYSALVTKYWPEYGQFGKENTTVAEILSHRAGLPVESAVREQFLNWTTMIRSLEQQRPAWPPGSAQVYHALTYGWLAGELIRRVDRKNRTLGEFIREEIATPLGIEFYIGLPASQIRRVSPLIFNREILRMVNQSIVDELNFYNDPLLYRAEVPGANGITNARSVAKFYASLITDLENGTVKRLLNESTLQSAITPSKFNATSNTSHNELALSFGMGFMLFDSPYPIRGAKAFGHPGKHDDE